MKLFKNFNFGLIYVFLIIFANIANVSSRMKSHSHRFSRFSKRIKTHYKNKNVTVKDIVNFLIGLLTTTSVFGFLNDDANTVLSTVTDMITCKDGTQFSLTDAFTTKAEAKIRSISANYDHSLKVVVDYLRSLWNDSLLDLDRREINDEYACKQVFLQIKAITNFDNYKYIPQEFNKLKTLVDKVISGEKVDNVGKSGIVTWDFIRNRRTTSHSNTQTLLDDLFYIFLAKWDRVIQAETKDSDRDALMKRHLEISKREFFKENSAKLNDEQKKFYDYYAVQVPLCENIRSSSNINSQKKISFLEKFRRAIVVMGPLCKCLGKTIISSLVSYITGALQDKLFSIALNLLFPLLGTAIKIFVKMVSIMKSVYDASTASATDAWYMWGVVVGQFFNLILDVVTGGRRKKLRLK
jgi:hypothetical protein